jgi:hypothetical protein
MVARTPDGVTPAGGKPPPADDFAAFVREHAPDLAHLVSERAG